MLEVFIPLAQSAISSLFPSFCKQIWSWVKGHVCGSNRRDSNLVPPPSSDPESPQSSDPVPPPPLDLESHPSSDPLPPPFSFAFNAQRTVAEGTDAKGKKWIFLGAKCLKIEHVRNEENWEWVPCNGDSCAFGEVALLREDYHLEVTGFVHTKALSPNTYYVACLVFKLTENHCGFDKYPVKVSIKLKAGVRESIRYSSKVYLKIVGTGSELPCQRKDDWLEARLGVYFNCEDEPGCPGELMIKLLEPHDDLRKSGLIIAGIEIRPQS